MSGAEIGLVLLWGTLVGLDLVTGPQTMIARPLVAGTVAGWLLGDAVGGFAVGAVLELCAVEIMPFGSARYADYGLGAVSAAPHQITWPAVPSGTYTLTARATDDAGATAVSADVIVSVTPGGVLPSPGRRRAGGCGATGIEVVIPLILVLARPRRRKPRRS